MLRDMKMLVNWLFHAVALLCVAYLYSGVEVHSFGAAMVAALLIGLLNIILRPVLILLTLPATLLTLGLFLFIVNGIVFWAAAALPISGFEVRGFWAAVWGSILYSILGMVIDSALQRLFPR